MYAEFAITFTEFTDGHQYRRTDGLVGTGLRPGYAYDRPYA